MFPAYVRWTGALRRFRENQQLQARLRRLGMLAWAATLILSVLILVLFPPSTKEAVRAVTKSTIYVLVAVIAGYWSLSGFGKGFAKFAAALFPLAIVLWALLLRSL